VFDRVAVSALLTERGAAGARVVRATGVHARMWVDAWGRPLDTFDQRCRPAPGQKLFIMGGGSSSHPHPGLEEYLGPRPIPDSRGVPALRGSISACR
jgi:hypothetical protein